jgi:hypothetical protein
MGARGGESGSLGFEGARLRVLFEVNLNDRVLIYYKP